MIKKIFFIYLILKIIFFIGVYYYFNNYQKEYNTTLLVIKNNELQNKPLHIFLIRYLSKEKIAKVLFVNDDITVLKKKVKSIQIKENFYLQSDNKKIDFIKNEIKELFDDKITIDNYICVDIELFNSFIERFKDIDDESVMRYKEYMISDDDYINAMIYNVKFIKHFVDNVSRYTYFKDLKFLYDNKNKIISNISIKKLFNIYYSIKSLNNIEFADLTTINKKNRIIADNVFIPNVVDFLYNIKTQYNQEKIKVEVLNSSRKQRLAMKVVDKLRNNGFDIFDWGSYMDKIDNTVIFDYNNNYRECEKIQKIINCGYIIFKPNNKPFADISVILASDCNIVDKLDKIE